MSETRSDRKTDSSGKRSDSGEKIIDAEVEPLTKTKPRRALKVAVFLGLALIGSVAIAALYHLWSTDRLDQIFAGRTPQPSSPTAVTLPVSPSAPALPAPAPAAETAPAANAPSGTAPSGTAPSDTAPADSAQGDSTQAGRIDALEQRLAALTASIERLQQLPAAASGTNQQALADLEARLKAAEADRAELQQKIALLIQTAEAQTSQRGSVQQQVTGLQQQIAGLQDRLAALGDRNVASLREPLTQLLAWGELRDRARRGQRFTAEAAAILPYAEGQGGALQQAASGWQGFAEAPPPALPQLQRRFAPLIDQQLTAKPDPEAQPDPAAQTWWQRALGKVAGLVSIRKLGNAAEAAPETRLAEAEAAMAAGNAPAALAALEGLELTPDFAQWRAQMQARLALNAALDAYGAALRAHLAALQ